MKSPMSTIHAALAALISASVVTVGLSLIDTNDTNAFAAPVPSPTFVPKKKIVKKSNPVGIPGGNTGTGSRFTGGRNNRGGSNIGSGTGRASGLGDVTAWCRGSIGILNMAKNTAVPATLNSDFAGSLATLRSGIAQAITNAQADGLDQSLTLKSLERTLQIGDSLYMALIGSEDRDRMVVNFYMDAYDFITKVADQIDIPVFIPYIRSNTPFDPLVHEQRFADYGAEQLKWLLEKFTYEDREQYYTNFDATIYLTLAESIASGVAQDLSESIFVNAYACQVQDLMYLGQMLGKHNAGDKSVYQGRNKYAVNSSVAVIKNVIQKLKVGCSHAAF